MAGPIGDKAAAKTLIETFGKIQWCEAVADWELLYEYGSTGQNLWSVYHPRQVYQVLTDLLESRKQIIVNDDEGGSEDCYWIDYKDDNLFSEVSEELSSWDAHVLKSTKFPVLIKTQFPTETRTSDSASFSVTSNVMTITDTSTTAQVGWVVAIFNCTDTGYVSGLHRITAVGANDFSIPYTHGDDTGETIGFVAGAQLNERWVNVWKIATDKFIFRPVKTVLGD